MCCTWYVFVVALQSSWRRPLQHKTEDSRQKKRFGAPDQQYRFDGTPCVARGTQRTRAVYATQRARVTQRTRAAYDTQRTRSTQRRPL